MANAIVDTFTRTTLGVAPNGQPYINADRWIVDVAHGLHPQAPIDDPYFPLLHDTYRANGTFTSLTILPSAFGQGLALRWYDNAHFVHAFKVNNFVYVFKHRAGLIDFIGGWGPADSGDDRLGLMPVIAGNQFLMTVGLQGRNYTVSLGDTELGTVTDIHPGPQTSTIHGVWGEFYSPSPGGTSAPQITEMTMAFDLADHLVTHAIAPLSTRPALTPEHALAHSGTLAHRLGRLPTDLNNAAPVGSIRYPIGIVPTAISEFDYIVTDDDSVVVDEDGNPIVWH